MLHLIYGLSGTGKTAHLIERIKEDVKNGTKAFLIVPEQQTVEIERIMASILPPSAQLDFEVVNFTRLANKLFRIYGGLSYHYITKAMKELFMWQALRTLAPFLKEYEGKKANDPALPSAMLSAISELKAYDIAPARLEQVAKSLPDERSLKNKLTDLSLLYSAYEGMVKESYDDSSDDLGKLTELLETRDFFKNCHVYVDSFIDFTAQEYRVLKCILAQADEVFITLLSEGPNTKDIFLSSVSETSRRLRALVGEKTDITVLKDFHRFSSPHLERIARDLWHFHVKGEKQEIAEPQAALALKHCTDAYSEAKATVTEILSLVQEKGYRFREIAVIARNAEGYRGILDAELEKAGIPFFMSEKTDLATKPLVSMIFSVLAIKQKNYRASDVITYIKTGLSGFTLYEADLLEAYTSTWRIHGTQFTSGDWSMNPDGYTETISARGKAILEAANSARRKLVDSLTPFFAELDNAKTVADFCNALYRFLKNSNVAERLSDYAARALDEGDKKEATETASIFRTVFGVLTDIVEALGEEEIDLEEFSAALRIVFGRTEIGTIPTAADEVMVGSASMLRATGIRAAILIGLCEGEFPMRVS
ncbi:MAG: exodeoxyribonuclease V subunit gamma, partial [Clostridia bacterium]|nr:exodeoxyribonuclease V subunit gamma [Clostridia bacterium]